MDFPVSKWTLDYIGGHKGDKWFGFLKAYFAEWLVRKHEKKNIIRIYDLGKPIDIFRVITKHWFQIYTKSDWKVKVKKTGSNKKKQIRQKKFL